ncbi:unnamed protein product [Somion occarium]|uniref:MYND-type domain-containing protein n=1 Tax=Somion occarium TaxID=3059160 RepID=A0ABP1CNJ3_9APHY
MSGPELNLTIIVYGSSETDPSGNERFCGERQRRAEIELRPRVPNRDMLRNQTQMNAWAQGVLNSVGVDVKHTQKWHCEFCTKPARETVHMVMSWMHLNPPKLNVYVHNICDAGVGRCSETLRSIQAEAALFATGGPGLPPRLPPAADGQYPLAASCARCKREETAEQDLQRCSRCKLIRYCCVNCQREDWVRHKVVCRMVKNVAWVWD